MNSFDNQIISYINQFARHSGLFDNFIGIIASIHLLKGGVLSTIIWWAWFKSGKRHSNNRENIILTLFSCCIAIIFGRALALMLPFRIRPLHEESLNFILPYGMKKMVLEGWSSFPSDHAVLFFALSTGLFFVSKHAGVIAISYTILFITFPRLYLGLHYPTDIIAGAIIGMLIAILANIYLIKNIKLKSIVNWSHSKPNFFYPLFFLITYQIADMFDSARAIIDWVFKFIHPIIA